MMAYPVLQHSFHGKSSKVADRRKPASTAPWTASRCNRLLRTITSRIAVLRRLKKLDDQIRTAPVLTQEQSLSESRPSSSASEQGNDCPDSPEWLPGRGIVRPIKRTYAGRKKLSRAEPGQARTQSSGNVFPTPLVKKIMSGPEQSSPFPVASPLNTVGFGRAASNRRSTKLPVRPLSSSEEAHRNLLAAFETLLNSTRPPDTPTRAGARSLTNMCLSKVAHYIELEEEALVLADVEESQVSDVAFDLYSELETLGTKVGGGWAGLRQVIRMHGIRHIELAIIDGMIQTPLIDQLLDTCNRLSAFRESYIIMEAHSQRSNIDLDAFWFQRSQSLFAHGGSAYWLRSIATLLRTGRLSYQQFGEQTLRALWRTFLGTLASTDCTAAMEFLHAYIASLNQGKDGDSWHTTARLFKGLVDVLGMLTAIMLISEATNTRQNTIRLLHQVIAIHKFDTGPISLDSAIATIMLLMNSMDCKPRLALPSPDLARVLERVQDMRQDLARKRMTSCATVRFICSIGTTVEKNGAASGSTLLRRILSSLVKTTSTDQTSIKRMMERLVHDCAVCFSVDTGDRSVLEALQDGTLSLDPLPPSGVFEDPASSQARGDYRWEDGLCEWIANSPMARTSVSEKYDVAARSLNAEAVHNGKAQQVFAQIEHDTNLIQTLPQVYLKEDRFPHNVPNGLTIHGKRKADCQTAKSDTREPLADLGLSKQNCIVSPTLLQPDAKKRKTMTGINGVSNRCKVSESYTTDKWTSKDMDGQTDELALLTPIRTPAPERARKKVRWDVSCQDKIHSRAPPVRKRSDCRVEETCGLLSPGRSSCIADNMSEDELAM